MIKSGSVPNLIPIKIFRRTLDTPYDMEADALIINPDLEGRILFERNATQASAFRSLQLSSSLDEGLHRLHTERNCDAIYVSERYDLSIVTSFVRSAKNTPRGADSAYLFVAGSAERTEANVRSAGFDGVLTEPCSAKKLRASARLALHLKKIRAEARHKQTLTAIVSSAAQCVDEAWVKAKSGMPHSHTLRKLNFLTDRVKQLPAEFQTLYFELLAEFMEGAPIPPVPERSRFQGQRTNGRIIRRRY